MQIGKAMLSPGTIYRSEAVITAAAAVISTVYRSESAASTAAANLRECPDCGHAAYHHTLAGCLASNGVGPICVCEMPRDDVDGHHEQEEPEE